MRATLLSLIAALAFVASSEAFAPAVLGARLTLRSSSTRGVGGLCMQQDNDDGKQMPRRSGASIDADGKSNVWALEPKIVVVDPKSSDKANPLIAPAVLAGGLALIGAILALTGITNVEQ
ncbi:hypothetical protein T484DRAFT_1798219 [Baffinella frigidus]|nr:hypothetical protein T484DRAFT_1798219 [Cryptophyta sp. CCMP2293]